jgi:hypothetical protein
MSFLSLAFCARGDSGNEKAKEETDRPCVSTLVSSAHGDSVILVRKGGFPPPPKDLPGLPVMYRNDVYEISLLDLPSTGTQTLEINKTGRVTGWAGALISMIPPVSAARSERERTTLLAMCVQTGASNFRLAWIPDSGNQDKIVWRQIHDVFPRGKKRALENRLNCLLSPCVLYFKNDFVIAGSCVFPGGRVWAGKAANIRKDMKLSPQGGLEDATILGMGGAPALFEHKGRLYCRSIRSTPRTSPGTGRFQEVVGWVSADGDNWMEWEPGVPLESVDALRVYEDDGTVYLACWETGANAAISVFKMTDLAKGFELVSTVPPGPGQSSAEAVGVRKKSSQLQILRLSKENDKDTLRFQTVE